MHNSTCYPSPLGDLFLTCDETGLTGLRFQNGAFSADERVCSQEAEGIFGEAKRWLDLYFSGQEPDFIPPLHLNGTSFQREVWSLLLRIPYGETTTYGALAKRIAQARGCMGCVSAQAVGGAIGRNPILILVPCHRVVGAGGVLTGYSGGLARKQALLEREGVDTKRLCARRWSSCSR